MCTTRMKAAAMLMAVVLTAGSASATTDGGGGWPTSADGPRAKAMASQEYSSSSADLPDMEQVSGAVTMVAQSFYRNFMDSFLHTVNRARRSAQPQEQGYLDAIVTGVGAIMGQQNCRQRVTCNAGKLIQSRVPGAQLAVIMAESFVPPDWMNWYTTVKSSVIDRSDNCATAFECDLLPPS